MKVKLSADPEREVTITLRETRQGGASGADYSGVPASLVFNSGDTEKSITFAATQDTVDDDGESVKIGFGNSLPTGVTEGSTDETTVSITDDDVPSVDVSFGAATYTAAEGGSVTVAVRLSADPERSVTIPLTKTNQGGASADDYSGVPASLTFNAGDTEKTFDFAATADAVDDDGESVKLEFGTLPTGVSEGSTDETTVSITDDDVPAVTVSFEQGSYTVAEGSSVTVKVKLSVAPQRQVVVPLTKTGQGGASPADYSGVPDSVTFEAADTEKTFSFSATQDTVDDDEESVKLGFGATLPTGVTAGTTDETVVSITDDDIPQVTVAFEQGSYTVAEGASVTVKVKLSADPERTVSIPITKAEQDGASSADYSGVPANVSFNSGETEKTFSFAATQDTVDDDGEKVKLAFGSSLPTGVTEGTTDETVVSITDDDVPTVTVSFSAGSYSAQEGGTVQVKLTLSEAPERQVIIPLTKTNQGGATDADYSGVPANVTFGAADAEKSFTFTATDDAVDDDGESVKLALGTLPTGVTAGTNDEATVNITDGDDPAVSISFENSSYDVDEGSSVTIKVTLSADPERSVTIPLTSTPQDGASSADYSGVPSSLTFVSGDTEETFSLSATDDAVDDDGEKVLLGFGTLPAGVNAGTNANATVSIGDDDHPGDVKVSFENSTYSATEGGTVTVKVTLTPAPERAVTIPLATTNQDGATSGDYSGVPANLAFAATDTEKTFTFSATDDSVDDDGESVKVDLGTLPAGLSDGTNAETVISITDNDNPAVTVSFEQSSYTVAEGSSVTVKVALSAQPERPLAVAITATGLDGAGTGDYSGAPTTLNFGGNDTEKTLSISATDDTEDDDGEKVRLGFPATLPAGVSAGTNSTATVSITDNNDPDVTVSFEQASYTVAEGAAVTVKVELNADPERTVTIPLTKADQGGASTADYSGVPASVTFDAGDTQKSFTFSATQDTTDDDGESVTLGFGSTLPSGVTEGTTDETVVSITDDDRPDQVTVEFRASSYAVPEGGTVNVSLTLSEDPEQTLSIPLTTTNQGGASDSDYSGVPVAVTFDAGDTSKTFTVSGTEDAVTDPGEKVKLAFGSLPTGTVSGTTDESTITILDVAAQNSLRVSFERPYYAVAEGNTVSVKVELNQAPGSEVVIPLTRTAKDGASAADYSGVPTSVTFGATDQEKTFTFTAAQDSIDDDGESVLIGFGTLPGGITADTPDETTVNIQDDDVPAVMVSFEQNSYTVAEGSTTAVKVKLSADPERTVTIPVSKAGQGGASSADYSGVPATTTFNAGDTEKTITFAATADSVDDDGESVKLSFGATLPNGVTEGTINETVITITDDDVPDVMVSFEQDSYTVAEGSTVTVKVKLDQDPERTVTVPITATNEGGASSSDYSGVPASVTFNSGDTAKDITFSATDDSVDDDGESVKLSFGPTLPSGVSEGTTASSVVSITDDDVPSVTVSFENATYSVDEGNSVTVKVQLSADPERTVTIPMSKTDQGGASSADYSGVPASVVFNSGDTAKDITFAATQDTVDDDGESVKLEFGTLPTGVTGGSTDETTVSIGDDDVPGVTVQFEQATYTAAEGNSVSVKVTLDEAPERQVVIPLTQTAQGGVSSADYSGVPANVSFGAAHTEKTFSFAATADSLDDDGESVKITFGTLPAGVSEGTRNETVVSITDDDVPAVTVSFEQSSYTVAEGSSVTVKVKLSADPERTVTVPLSKTEQDGATSADYSGVPDSVIFNSGDTEKELTFTAVQDAGDDDGESVKLGFGGTLPTGVSTGTRDETVVSITDDDVPSVSVSFEQDAYTAAEGGSVTVKVRLSADPERTVTIPLSKTDQGGATSADYSGVPTSIVFNSGDTEKTFDFAATADDVDDDGESVKLGFGSTLPASVSAGTTNETVVSITDDDVPDSLTANFGAATYSASEGSTVEVKVTLNKDPERTVVIPLARENQGGASDSDYSGVPADLTFDSGDTEKAFTFSAKTDLLADAGEKVKLTLGTLPSGVGAGTTSETIISILEVAPQSSLLVSFEAPDYIVNEGNGVTVTVELNQAPGSDALIPLTAVNQGGASTADYSGVPANLTFGATDTSKGFTFTATQDTVDDDGEKVLLGFGTLPSGVNAGTTSETVVSINDDDDPQVKVSFEQGNYTVAEGGTVTVKVKLDADPERTVAIPLTTMNQGGASSADYSGVPASVAFNSGDTEKSFSLAATADTVDDDGEIVKLGFGATLPTGVSAGTTDETVVSITDDDLPSVTVSFGQDSYTVAEGSSVTVKVKLSEDPERTVTIPLTKTDQGGASSADYSGVPTSVVFNTGDTEKTFDFSATADTVDDDDESVKLGFGTTLPTGVTAGTTDESTVSITDDDVPSVSASYEQGSYAVNEGASVTVKVKLDTDPERTVTIPLTSTNQGGASNADYSGVPASVVFNSGDTEKSFSFAATQDTVDDDGESVKLTFGTLPTGVSAGTTDETVVSITDDDLPTDVKASFEQSSYTVAEGSNVTVKVKLDADPERTVVIPLTKTDQGGASGSDYSGVPASLTFNSGVTEQSFDVLAAADELDDDGESVKLGFGPLPAGVSSGTPGETVVSITDDDLPAVAVSFGAATYTAAEGSSVTITVSLSGNPERTVTIPLTKTEQGGATPADYSGVPTGVTFNSGETEKTFDFSAATDDVDDDGESVKITFGALPTGVTGGSVNETMVSITDNDDPAVAVKFGQATHSVAEGSSIDIAVSLSSDPERTVTIPLTATNQGGATGDDYSGVPASVTFNSGETQATFSLTATEDDLDEEGESVRLTFGTLPSGVREGSVADTTISITDKQTAPPIRQPLPRITIRPSGSDAGPVAEGTDLLLEMERSGPATEGLSGVRLTVTETGSALGSPMTVDDGEGNQTTVAVSPGATLQLEFPAGVSTLRLALPTLDDEVDEENSEVTVQLLDDATSPDRYALGQPDAVTITINDNDEPPPHVVIELSPSSTVPVGTEIAVTMKFASLPPEFDESYRFLAQVAGEDRCHGEGLGIRRFIDTVDQDPEVRHGTIPGTCPEGDYQLGVTLYSGEEDELAAATAGFSITAPVSPAPEITLRRYEDETPAEVDEGSPLVLEMRRSNGEEEALNGVRLQIAETGEVLLGTLLTTDVEGGTMTLAAEPGGMMDVEFYPGHSTRRLWFETMDDSVDEADSEVTFRVMPDVRVPAQYLVGNPGSASVMVKDNDQVLVPTPQPTPVPPPSADPGDDPDPPPAPMELPDKVPTVTPEPTPTVVPTPEPTLGPTVTPELPLVSAVSPGPQPTLAPEGPSEPTPTPVRDGGVPDDVDLPPAADLGPTSTPAPARPVMELAGTAAATPTPGVTPTQTPGVPVLVLVPTRQVPATPTPTPANMTETPSREDAPLTSSWWWLLLLLLLLLLAWFVYRLIRRWLRRRRAELTINLQRRP